MSTLTISRVGPLSMFPDPRRHENVNLTRRFVVLLDSLPLTLNWSLEILFLISVGFPPIT